MAERRMFSKTIVDSDLFIDMPLSTQCLYFHLSMRADDEGFINSVKRIQKMVGASDDDLKLLIAKQFIIPFESGIVVVKHWFIHNYIQKDRKKDTVHVEEKALLTSNKLTGYSMDTNCVQLGRVGKVRLVKESIDKSSEGELDENKPNFCDVIEFIMAKNLKINAIAFHNHLEENDFSNWENLAFEWHKEKVKNLEGKTIR